VRVRDGRTVLTTRGRSIGRTPASYSFRRAALRAGTYRVVVSLRAPVNVGPPGTRTSAPFRVTT
jgi:hypothetical protein